MSRKSDFQLRITERFREAVEERTSASGIAQPVAGIICAKSENDKEGYLIGVYDKLKLSKGHEQDKLLEIFKFDDTELVVPQDQVRDALNGKCVDFIDGKVVVVARPHVE